MTSRLQPRRAAVIGGGPAGLMAAETLSRRGIAVTVYERMPTAGRKFLMAGRGGLNLTHSEPAAAFLARYGAAADRLAPALAAFGPQDLRAWAAALGQETFVGSSGRVFPQALKASPLLRAWLGRLDAQGVAFRLRHDWRGWTPSGALCFAAPGGAVEAAPDLTVLALGGASWPRLGTDGGWAAILRDAGVAVTPLRPANCGFEATWSNHLRTGFAGTPLKAMSFSHQGVTVRGEAVLTGYGLEGGAIYALSRSLRRTIEAAGQAELVLDLKPGLSQAALEDRLSRPPGRRSLSNILRKQGLAPVAVALLREGRPALPAQPAALAALVKALPVTLTAARPLDRAISTAGGVALDELDENFMLKRQPGVYAIGEMLDWEAPTGGYLLQACFGMGVLVGRRAGA